MTSNLEDARVAIAGTGSGYDSDPKGRIWDALLLASTAMGWQDNSRGPLAKVIPPGSRVLIKPNLVLHQNDAPYGIESVVTHTSVVNVAFEAARLAGANEIIVGDAPLQRCDFAAMLRVTGLDRWERQAAALYPGFGGIRDFRRTISTIDCGIRHASEDQRPTDEFTLFDLGSSSLLEPVTSCEGPFRVTCYDPNLLQCTHSKGRHQYLVAKDVLQSDVVINAPKLKTHRKSGITCALKNIVGINGNKEFLPHHRTGGSTKGGDCYPGSSRAKALLEYMIDRQNSTHSDFAARFWAQAQSAVKVLAGLRSDEVGVEGAWFGNDTVWRMCLDLNRILLYGRPDGTLADEPQRIIIHLVDAVIAGQGEGPLAPEPLPLGLILTGRNPAAVDWVGALLLGYDPRKIPLTRNAFDVAPFPIAKFQADAVEICGALGTGNAVQLLQSQIRLQARHPAGWLNAALNRQSGIDDRPEEVLQARKSTGSRTI